MASGSAIRWQQRFENYEDALRFLQDAVNQESHSDLEKAGIVQTFEFTFELAWKTVKDFLSHKGSAVKYPRDVLKEGFSTGLLRQGETWMEMLDSRNLMAHTYRTKDSEYVFEQITTKYVQVFDELRETLKSKI